MKTTEELKQRFQEIQQQINELIAEQNQIIGKINLLEEIEKENKKK